MHLSSLKRTIFCLFVSLVLGCSANSQVKKRTNTSAQSITSTNILNELKGCWHPILHTISDVYAQDTNEISKYMQQKICIDRDTSIIFSDTIVFIKVNHLVKTKKEDWIFQNIDAGQREVYNILAPEIWNIRMDCKVKEQGKSTFSDTRGFAYDGKYLYYGADGFNFLLVKDSSEIKKTVGKGSAVKEFALTGKEKEFTLSYEFYTDPDEIIIYDQSGRELYQSAMKSTDQEESTAIKLDNVTKLTIKINSKTENSRWAFWYDAK